MKCRGDSSNLHFCGRKGTRAAANYKSAPPLRPVLFRMKMVPRVTKLSYISNCGKALLNYAYIPAHTPKRSSSSFAAFVCLSGFEKAPLAFGAHLCASLNLSFRAYFLYPSHEMHFL